MHLQIHQDHFELYQKKGKKKNDYTIYTNPLSIDSYKLHMALSIWNLHEKEHDLSITTSCSFLCGFAEKVNWTPQCAIIKGNSSHTNKINKTN